MANQDAQKKLPAWAKRDRMDKAQVIEQLGSYAEAAWSMALKTTDVDIRDGYMDRCHVLREAKRLLGG